LTRQVGDLLNRVLIALQTFIFCGNQRRRRFSAPDMLFDQLVHDFLILP